MSAPAGAAAPPMSRLKRDLLFFGMAVLVFVFDQATKIVVRASLAPGESIPADGWFRFTHVTNTGAAFGLFQGQGPLLLLTTVIGVAAIVTYYLYPPVQTPVLTTSLGLQLGGAIGNLVDRVTLGHVTDFFDFRIWPVFNIADSAIVVGVVVLTGYMLLFDRSSKAAEVKAPPGR